MSIPSVLENIVEHKKQEVAARRERIPFELLNEQLKDLPATKGFKDALIQRAKITSSGIIAEVKKASPSKGVIREDFRPVEIAKSYEVNGAACLSVLTDEEFFKGADEYLIDIRKATELPILRKDFIIDEYQIVESRVMGADCILLIVAILTDRELSTFYSLARSIGLDVLIEVHDETEMRRALKVDCELVGINNRNLHTFDTSLETTTRMLGLIPMECFVVTESGIHTPEDVELMRSFNVRGFLVGEAFMRQSDPGQALTDLFYS